MQDPRRSEEAIEAMIRKLKSQTWSTPQRGASGSALFARIPNLNFRPILPRPDGHEAAEGPSAQARAADAQAGAKGNGEVGMEVDTTYGARPEKEQGENAPKASP